MATITVRYFAAAEEAAERPEEQLEIPEGATLGWLREHLAERHGPKMQRVLKSGSFLVDGLVRRDSDEFSAKTVDVLPPFAGG